MAKHRFPKRWWDPKLGVRYMTAHGELWDCTTATPTGLSVDRRIEIGPTR